MQVKLKRTGSTLIVQMMGELDHHAVDAMREKIDVKLLHEDIKNILFDFQGVNFMDSSGLGMILGRYKIVSAKGGKVLACSLNPRVRRIFELAGLENKIPVFSSKQDALAGA
ncbi:MAG: anti-sigma F factor antagonist [Dethiobacteraceae bacterium]|nr:anti-sigma F factor antagonist [Bacillota bacterium]